MTETKETPNDAKVNDYWHKWYLRIKEAMLPKSGDDAEDFITAMKAFESEVRATEREKVRAETLEDLMIKIWADESLKTAQDCINFIHSLRTK